MFRPVTLLEKNLITREVIGEQCEDSFLSGRIRRLFASLTKPSRVVFRRNAFVGSHRSRGGPRTHTNHASFGLVRRAEPFRRKMTVPNSCLQNRVERPNRAFRRLSELDCPRLAPERGSQLDSCSAKCRLLKCGKPKKETFWIGSLEGISIESGGLYSACG